MDSLKRFFFIVIFFHIVSCGQASVVFPDEGNDPAEKKDLQSQTAKSIIFDNIHEYPRGFVDQPLGLRSEPPGFVANPSFLSSNPPNTMEADKIPQADNDPSLRIRVDNHPASAKKE